MICAECNGSKVYVGLTVTEPCRGCEGKGYVGAINPNQFFWGTMTISEAEQQKIDRKLASEFEQQKIDRKLASEANAAEKRINDAFQAWESGGIHPSFKQTYDRRLRPQGGYLLVPHPQGCSCDDCKIDPAEQWANGLVNKANELLGNEPVAHPMTCNCPGCNSRIGEMVNPCAEIDPAELPYVALVDQVTFDPPMTLHMDEDVCQCGRCDKLPRLDVKAVYDKAIADGAARIAKVIDRKVLNFALQSCRESYKPSTADILKNLQGPSYEITSVCDGHGCNCGENGRVTPTGTFTIETVEDCPHCEHGIVRELSDSRALRYDEVPCGNCDSGKVKITHGPYPSHVSSQGRLAVLEKNGKVHVDYETYDPYLMPHQLRHVEEIERTLQFAGFDPFSAKATLLDPSTFDQAIREHFEEKCVGVEPVERDGIVISDYNLKGVTTNRMRGDGPPNLSAKPTRE